MIARPSTRIALLTIAGTVLAAGIAAAAPGTQAVAHAATPAAKQTLVGAAQRPTFGHILVNGRGFALYYWAQETKGTVKCTGQCAAVWPPLLIPRGATAPMHVAGVMGTFGVAMRPDGNHQLTFNHHPLYTYVGDKTASQVLCDGVQGWHVVRLSR